MRNTSADPLYFIFEQHLMNALVEDEGTDVFLSRVVADYVARLISAGTVIPREVLPVIEHDLREEVLEMLRKKTYGHFSLADFRRAKGVEPVATASTTTPTPTPQNEQARRTRRAC